MLYTNVWPNSHQFFSQDVIALSPLLSYPLQTNMLFSHPGCGLEDEQLKLVVSF